MKHEAPPFRMRIERGAMLPTSAWEQERLGTYRNGSIVNVHITQAKNRKLERKYWAILGEVIKSCPIKQRTKEDLHKAIRLKLGVVDAFWSFGGQLKVEVKSTSAMEDPEYQQFYEEAMALLHQETGVDPEQLSANSPDVGEDEHEPSDIPPSGEEGSGPADPSTGIAADQSPSAAAEAGEPEVAADQSTAPASDIIILKRECLDKFLAAATDPTAPDAKDRQATIIFAKDAWKQSLPTELDFVKKCLETADAVVKGNLSSTKARRYLEGLL